MKIAPTNRPGCWARTLAACVAVELPAPALAHADRAADASTLGWNVTPDIFIGILLVGALYAAGGWRQRGKDSALSRWKHLSFFSGLTALLVALQSPLDALAEHFFFLHQVQHLLLQTVSPMLLMLAAPQRLLVVGMPPTLRRHVLAPMLSSGAVRAVFAFLARPWIAALSLVASLYIWHWPPYHDWAVLNSAAHYLMHITMLAAGLVFYACVFDSRPAPPGTRYGTRVNILWFAMTANMLLGAALALKETALYTAYDRIGWFGNLAALGDERLGGLIMWMPGSAACVPAFLVLLRMWNAQETRIDERRRHGIALTPHAAAATNHRVALWLVLAACIAFAGTLGVGVITTGHRFGSQ